MNSVCPSGTLCLSATSVFIIMGSILLVVLYYFVPRGGKETKNNKIVYKVKEETVLPPSYIQGGDTSAFYRRVADPLTQPEQTYPFRESVYNRVGQYAPRMAINIPTRGAETNFQSLGVLTSLNNTNRVLQLFGRAIYPGSNKWQYYTTTDNFQSVKVSVAYKNQNCLTDLGCDQLYTGDTIQIPAYPDDNFRVEIYNFDKPKYISYLV